MVKNGVQREYKPHIILQLVMLIMQFLVTGEKFLESSGYYTTINCTFNFITKNVFGYFHPVRTRDK